MSDRRQTGSTHPASASDPAPLFLETLGGAALLAAGPAAPPATIFGPSKPLALIVYLASVPGHSATREFLIDLLWADLDPEAARHAFRQTLWYIKQKAGRPLIRATGEAVSLAEPVATDRADFLRAIEGHDFEGAVSLYHGDFLPDFAAPGGLQFEHWADLERQRLRDTFTRAAEHVVRHCLATARHRDAVALARRARDVDALSERAWRLVLESLISASDSLGASMEADAFQKMLADEGHEAEPATRSLLRAARQLSTEPQTNDAAPTGIVAELVGREAEFSTLLAAWDEARSGLARKVSIVGAAGIGKTRLVTDVAARLRATRARVVWVRANPGEREIAYAFLSKLAGALATLPGAAAVSPASAAALVALNPTLSNSFSAAADRAAGPDALRHRTIAVHELLAAAADEAPVAVIVDDLHWADRDSARALAGLSDLLERERVLLISAARPSNGGGQDFPRDATVIRLAPLSAADTGALLASVAALPQTAIGLELPSLLRDASGGNPLLAIETLQFLLDQKSVRLERESWVLQDEQAVRHALNAGGALRRRIEALDVLERSVLIVVAMSGVPVPAGFVGDVVQRPLPDVAAVLHGLETRGMINHVGDGWEPVHDQIGEMALSTLDPGRRIAMELTVGRAWMRDGSDDRAVRRAGVHFLRAGDRSAVAHAFAAWVRLVRRSGDRRPAPALAAEFLDREDAALVGALVRHLPIHHRYGGARWRTAATVAFVAVASAAATWRWTREPEPPPDDVFLAVSVDSTGDTTTYRVPIRRDGWVGGDLLLLSRQGQRIRTALPTSLLDYTLGPAGKSWISWASMPDSGAVDLVQESMSGRRRRLTWARGDDAAPDLSPDGAQLVFASGRFDSLSHGRIAIMDLATGAVRQVSHGSGVHGTPKWSPDGTRIAFTEFPFSDAPDSVCTIAPDGTGQRCAEVGYLPHLLGWVDDERVIYTTQPDSLAAVSILDTRDNSVRRILHTSVGAYQLSPDGSWLSCRCRDAGALHAQTVVAPIDQPDLRRVVAVNALDTRPIWVVWATPRPARYVTAVTIPIPPHGLSVGMDYRLPGYATTADGRRVTLRTASERSLDPSILRTTSAGALLPVAPGTARLEVSAGGWRVDTVAIPITVSADSVVVRYDWSHGVDGPFVPFGVPRPRAVSDQAGRPAFWNHGDGDFPSGVYSRGTFDASDGAGIEMTLSLPITMFQWQAENIDLRAMRDSGALARWDHSSGYPTFDAWPTTGACSFAYPAGEGARSIRQLQVPGAFLNPDFAVGPPIHDGHWFRVRLQLFPDGRCGVAIDGRPLSITTTGGMPGGRYFATIDGQSYHTRILTGPVEIWTGIKPGVDWLAFDTARVAAAKPRLAVSRGAPRSP